jgi:hyperosmotically inducible protein
MIPKLATAVFLAGAILAPAASWAAGSNATQGSGSTQASGSMMNETKAAMSDTAITAKVKAKLATDRDVHSGDITVSTERGAVKLGGTAQSQQDADKAVDIAKATEGVTSVDNGIKVESGGAESGGAKY